MHLLLLVACHPPPPWEARALASFTVDFADVVRVDGRADLTGDGTADVLVATDTEGAWVFEGPLAGTLAAEDAAWTTSSAAWSVGDLDGDGVGELVTASGEGEDTTATVFRGPLPDPEEVGTVATTGVDAGWAAEACDIDGDGVRELVLPGEGEGAVVLDAALAELRRLRRTGATGDAPAVECLGDLDGDGAEAVRFGDDLYFGADREPVSAATDGWSLALPWRAGDVTGDGAADLLVPSGTAVSVYAGPVTTLGATALPIQGIDADWAFAQELAAGADANGDGVADLLVGWSRLAEDPDPEDDMGPGMIALFHGPIDAPLALADAAVSWEGGTIVESCHQVPLADGKNYKTVCDREANDQAGKKIAGSYPSAGFLPDQDGDGGADVWVVTRTDHDAWGVWVIPGRAP